MLDKKVSEIIEGGRSNILDLQEILLKRMEQNTTDFFQNIKSKDYEKAQKNIDWGLDWKSKKILQQIKETFENSFQDIKSIEMLWNLKPDNITNEIILDFFKINIPLTANNFNEIILKFFKVKNPLNPEVVVKEIFKKRIERGYYKPLSAEVGLWLLDKQEIFSLDKKLVMKHIMNSLLTSSNLEKCEKLLDTIYSKNQELITDSLSAAMTQDNFNFMIKKYSFLFNKISNPLYQEKMMSDALEKGNLNIIRFLNESGQTYPNSKAPYAKLFGNINNKEAMDYVVSTIEDITVGNQVILKTALHYNRDKIIISILERYNQSQYEQISKATEKRVENEALQMIKYFYFKNKLENNLNNKSNNNKNSHKI